MTIQEPGTGSRARPTVRHLSGGMRLMLLVGLMGLTFQLEHMAGLHWHAIGALGFNLVPVLLGIAWLPPRLELMLGVVNLALLLLELARDSETPQVSAPLLISRILTVGLCFWIARLRADAERRRQELALKAEVLGDIVDTCLRASALAHEIRQPLSVILLSSQLLQQKLEQMEVPDPSCREHLAQMVACANQLNLTTSAMGAMMRSVKTDHVRLDLAAVVKSALLSLRPLLQSSAAELTSSDLDHPLPLIGDAEQLRIACGNLLSNALEALQMVPPSQRRLLVKLESRDGQATLTVADSGSGLPQEQIEQMILASTKSDGMGLGLFIAQAIARNHGGDLLAYRSLELGGAELRLTLDVNGRDPDRHRATRTYKSNQ